MNIVNALPVQPFTLSCLSPGSMPVTSQQQQLNNSPRNASNAAGESTHLTPNEFFSSFSNFQLLDINTHKPPHVASTHLTKPGSFTNVSVIAKPTQSEIIALGRSSSSRCCDVAYNVERASPQASHDLLSTSPINKGSLTNLPTAKSSFTAWSSVNDVIKQPPPPPQRE